MPDLDQFTPWSDPRENAPVPRWEVRQMIKDCVVSEIGTYERTIVAPRHAENQQALSKISEAVDGFKDLMKEVNGGIRVIKWLGGLVAVCIGAGGGIYAWARLVGHS